MSDKRIKIGNVVLENNVIVAPMAGVSDISFRSMLVDFKPGLIFSEMISDKGIVHRNQRTLDMCRVLEDEHPIALQLFGRDIDAMVEAAVYLDTQTQCDIIDINMGCPVAKVTSSNGGSSLLKEKEHAEKLVKAICKAVQKPVTIKMRIGWDQSSINAVEYAQAMERAGAQMISIHGRTRAQKYKGEVRRDVIKAVKNAVSIPVIGNGDIKTVEDARLMVAETGVDGVMMARAMLNNPWLIQEVKAAFGDYDYNAAFELKDRFDWLHERFENLIKLVGQETAVRKMRGYSTWFIAGMRNGRSLKSKLIRMNSLEEFDMIVQDYLSEEA